MKATGLGSKSYLAVLRWLGLLSYVLMNLASAQTNPAQSSIKITWSGAAREFYSYTMSSVRTNRVEIRLAADGKSLGQREAERAGGMESLLALVEQASKEVADKSASALESKPESKRRLEITFLKEGRAQKFSVAGDIKELTQFFHSTVALKALLKLASEEQPKAYRLIDESGPTKAMMLPPTRR